MRQETYRERWSGKEKTTKQKALWEKKKDVNVISTIRGEKRQGELRRNRWEPKKIETWHKKR